jgi:FixJ family two-component response regulator
MPDHRPTVFIVDDDASVRASLALLVESVGWRAQAFVARPHVAAPSCLLLDVVMPELGGCDLQALVAHRSDMPIIFISGRGDVPVAVRAIKAGAVDFLTKPLVGDVLVATIRDAIERSRAALADAESMRELRDRHASLSRREREVMTLVVAGRLNKQVGAALGISEITVKAHRGQVMRKMQAGSLPDLVQMDARLGHDARVT